MISRYKIEKESDLYTYIKSFISASNITIVSTTPFSNDTNTNVLILEIKKDELYLYLTFNSCKASVYAFNKYDKTKTLKEQEGIAFTEATDTENASIIAEIFQSAVGNDLYCIKTDETVVMATYNSLSYTRPTNILFWSVPIRYIQNTNNTTDDFYFGSVSNINMSNDFSICYIGEVDEERKWLYYTNKKYNIIPSIMVTQQEILGGTKVPTYIEEFTKAKGYGRGRFSCALNCTSMILPLIIYANRSPRLLRTYSAICYDGVINFIDMFDISSGKLIKQDFPYKYGNYICFNMIDRMRYKKYAGLAIRLSDNDMKNITDGKIKYTILED